MWTESGVWKNTCWERLSTREVRRGRERLKVPKALSWRHPNGEKHSDISSGRQSTCVKHKLKKLSIKTIASGLGKFIGKSKKNEYISRVVRRGTFIWKLKEHVGHKWVLIWITNESKGCVLSFQRGSLLWKLWITLLIIGLVNWMSNQLISYWQR